jgi:signal transduction histidine kinase
VRYISHELRTPLNTAFLGLKLLSSDLKASNDPKDIERYETLCDVNMSCTAAVDILNDLLCYEKLESGILELHKEDIVVDSFLKDFVLSFSVQARECGITVNTITEVSHRGAEMPSDDGKVSRSLLPDDMIYADKFKMDQVIRNLMSNALKFTPRGGSVTINASFVYDSHEEAMRCVVDAGLKTAAHSFSDARRASRKAVGRILRNPASVACCPDITSGRDTGSSLTRGKLVVVVTDTGAGISKENQARLFNEIVQFSPEKLQAGGGSGLGLWITQEILNLHDGSISVSSEGEGKGSSFTIEMPMSRCLKDSLRAGVGPTISQAPDDSTRDRKTDSERHDGIDSDSILSATTEIIRNLPRYTHPERNEGNSNPLYGEHGSSFEILIVDDSRLCRKMLLKCLRADGHTCFEAEDGLEAIAMVKERISHANGGVGRPYDAVLMDFIMPNMDGPTATKEIRALGYTSPIFGVTGNGESICGIFCPYGVNHYRWHLESSSSYSSLVPLLLPSFLQGCRLTSPIS